MAASSKQFRDLRYLFIRGLIDHEGKQRSRHYLKSAAECTSRAIVSLQLADQPIKSVLQARKLEGIGGETCNKLTKLVLDHEFSALKPLAGRFVSSAGAILVGLLDATEEALYNGHRPDKDVLISETSVRTRAVRLSEEMISEDPTDFCKAWWRLEVLIKRGLIKRRSYKKTPVLQLLPLGKHTALRLREQIGLMSTVPAEPKVKDPSCLQDSFKPHQPRDINAACATEDTGLRFPSLAIDGVKDGERPESSLVDALYTNDTGQDGVVLLIDRREMGGEKHGLAELCRLVEQRGLVYQTRHLATGDYSWLWRVAGHEVVLPCLVERKRADDVARTLHEGRFWSQVRKMVDWARAFKQRGMDCALQYILEHRAEEFVARCEDGCGAVVQCGFPTLDQIQTVLGELRQHPALLVKQTDNLAMTVLLLASITTELKYRQEKGEFDTLLDPLVTDTKPPQCTEDSKRLKSDALYTMASMTAEEKSHLSYESIRTSVKPETPSPEGSSNVLEEDLLLKPENSYIKPADYDDRYTGNLDFRDRKRCETLALNDYKTTSGTGLLRKGTEGGVNKVEAGLRHARSKGGGWENDILLLDEEEQLRRVLERSLYETHGRPDTGRSQGALGYSDWNDGMENERQRGEGSIRGLVSEERKPSRRDNTICHSNRNTSKDKLYQGIRRMDKACTVSIYTEQTTYCKENIDISDPTANKGSPLKAFRHDNPGHLKSSDNSENNSVQLLAQYHCSGLLEKKGDIYAKNSFHETKTDLSDMAYKPKMNKTRVLHTSSYVNSCSDDTKVETGLKRNIKVGDRDPVNNRLLTGDDNVGIYGVVSPTKKPCRTAPVVNHPGLGGNGGDSHFSESLTERLGKSGPMTIESLPDIKNCHSNTSRISPRKKMCHIRNVSTESGYKQHFYDNNESSSRQCKTINQVDKETKCVKLTGFNRDPRDTSECRVHSNHGNYNSLTDRCSTSKPDPDSVVDCDQDENLNYNSDEDLFSDKEQDQQDKYDDSPFTSISKVGQSMVDRCVSMNKGSSRTNMQQKTQSWLAKLRNTTGDGKDDDGDDNDCRTSGIDHFLYTQERFEMVDEDPLIHRRSKSTNPYTGITEQPTWMENSEDSLPDLDFPSLSSFAKVQTMIGKDISSCAQGSNTGLQTLDFSYESYDNGKLRHSTLRKTRTDSGYDSETGFYSGNSRNTYNNVPVNTKTKFDGKNFLDKGDELHSTRIDSDAERNHGSRMPEEYRTKSGVRKYSSDRHKNTGIAPADFPDREITSAERWANEAQDEIAVNIATVMSVIPHVSKHVVLATLHRCGNSVEQSIAQLLDLPQQSDLDLYPGGLDPGPVDLRIVGSDTAGQYGAASLGTIDLTESQ